jgi:signal transduction histidine kinase
MRILPEAFSKSIRVKFSLLLLLLLFLVFTLSSGVLAYRSLNTQRENLITQARAYAKLSAKPIGNTYSLYYDSGFLKFEQLVGEILVLNPDIEKVQIISVTGEVLFDSSNLGQEKPTDTVSIKDQNVLDSIGLNTESEIPKRSENSIPREIIEPYFEDFGAHPFSVRYFISYDSISQNLLSTILTTLFLSSIFFAGAIVLIILVVNRTILSPIETVIEGSEKISKGDLSHVIEVGTKDEVADLASAVNHMAHTLKKNIEDLKELDKLKDEFVLLASHNLRTPLTVIKGYISSIREDKTLDSKIRSDIENMSDSTKQLETITETLLSLVSLEKGQKVLEKKEVDLANLLEEVGGKLGMNAADKKVSFIFEFPSEPTPKIKLEKDRVEQAFLGLVDNAIKFNKEGGKVIVKLEQKNKEIVVSIRDEGIGIPEEERGKVFKKFHRATDVLTYNYEGIGLGLYLSKLIIESHQGKIWFESKVGEGSTFYVSLPKAVQLNI